MKRILPAVAILLIAASPAMRRAAFWRDCTLPVTGLTPIMDMGPGDSYLGEAGGLYPGGSNTCPPAHLQAGMTLATSQVIPRDSSGNPDPANGVIGVSSIGMSNMRLIFGELITQAKADPALNPRVRLSNGAQSGHAVDEWADPTSPAGADAWQGFADELSLAQIAPAQLQVVVFGEIGMRAWLQSTDVFPDRVQETQGHLEQVLRNIRTFYPNVRMCFLSSRSYAGWCLYDHDADAGTAPLRLVPADYEDGFAPKWTIARQIAGEPTLEYAGPAAVAPWVAWSPYLWADGTTPRLDGTTSPCAHYKADGHHQDAPGQVAYAQLTLPFFKSDPTAAPWFTKDWAPPPPADDDGTLPPPLASSSSGSGCSAAGARSLLLLMALGLLLRR